MWFNLSNTDYGDVYEKYKVELSQFNIRILHYPYISKWFGEPMMITYVLIEINTLEELIRLRNSVCNELILRYYENEIEIYDDYRE